MVESIIIAVFCFAVAVIWKWLTGNRLQDDCGWLIPNECL